MKRATEGFQWWEGEERWKNIWDGKITMLEDCEACEARKCWACGGVRGQVCDGRIKMSRGASRRGRQPGWEELDPRVEWERRYYGGGGLKRQTQKGGEFRSLDFSRWGAEKRIGFDSARAWRAAWKEWEGWGKQMLRKWKFAVGE